MTMLRGRRGRRTSLLAALVVAVAALAALPAAAGAHGRFVKPHDVGMLDCNGFSPIQHTLKAGAACSDPTGLEDGAPDRFYDNGHYIGHDEPIIKFISKRHGSGNNVTFVERLPRDPRHLPTVRNPGSDVTHWFELSIAPWFSMALCNPNSYPQAPCKPMSDSNHPDRKVHLFGGGGSSFLEMQFYAPGYAPFIDNISCDNTHWCASLHINDLECTNGFESCNNDCIEPTNFAFIQTNGVPTGPPSPQLATDESFTPNGHTLLMNPGDKLRIHIWNARVPGTHAHALKTSIDDLTTGRRGWMQASARNGYMTTRMSDCSGRPFNYQPEYDTARPGNVIPWAALDTNISTQFEIGHFEPCTKVTGPTALPFSSFTDTFWLNCVGPYESATAPDGGDNPEAGDAPCYPRGFTHHGHAPPNQVTGCVLFFFQNGDLDYDGTSYWPDWPNSVKPNRYPSPFLQRQPHTGGHRYERIQFQTNAPASFVGCEPSGHGCQVPIPGSPGHFYPYWTQARVGGQCVWEFGQMRNGRSFGKTRQYGGPSAHFFANLEGPIRRNPNC